MKLSLFSTSTGRPLLGTVAAVAAFVSSPSLGWSVSGTVKSSTGTLLNGVTVVVKDSTTIKTTTANGAFTLQHTVGVQARDISRSTSAWIDGSDLIVQGLTDGAAELSLVNASGRSLWNTKAMSSQGTLRASLPSNLSRGAIFLRVSNSQGTQIHAVSMGANGLAISTPAGRAMASFPVLEFSLTGYTTTTFAMTAENMTGVAITMTAAPSDSTCELPTTFKWKDYGKPVASPKNGWVAIKDFTHVQYNGTHYVHMTYYTTGWNSAAMSFVNWADADAAKQTQSSTGVAPELMYFTPKKIWINSKQWCSGGSFCWMESADVTKPTSFALKGNLLTETITVDKAAPIDQTLICDDSKCYIFYADDNGRIYSGSMPKANFPGTFTGTKKILEDTKTRLFEAVQVYKLKGQKKYLMLVECGWTRYFRAFTATDLGGTWTALGTTREEATPFAGAKNVTGGWSNDISHGDMIRSTNDEYREIDPCNLQLMYQGFKSPYSGDYGLTPYQMGLLTHIR